MIGTHVVELVTPTTPVENLLTDPRMTGSAAWTGVTYGAGLATISNSGGAYTPNNLQPVGTTVTVLLVLHNPTGAALVGDLSARATVGALFSGATFTVPTPVALAAGATATFTSTKTLSGPDNGFRILTTGLLGARVVGALAVVGAYAGPYFDGTSPGSVWSGTPNASTSVRSFDFLDLSCFLDQVTIRHGRTDPSSQPEASSATLEISYSSAEESISFALDVTADLRIATTYAGTRFERFRGTVTDLSIGWQELGEHTPYRVQMQVSAVGPLAALGGHIIGGSPWPAELDGARVSRIITDSVGVPDPLLFDPGTVSILAVDVDAQPALALAHEVAESAGGMLWQTRAGVIAYADAEHRRTVVTDLELDACDVLASIVWTRDLNGLINKVSIGYGEAIGDGEQPRYTAERFSFNYGTRALSIETVLADEAAAAAMGDLILIRGRAPAWVLSDLPLDLDSLDDARTAAALDLDVHSLVTVQGLPAYTAAPTTATLWVEGLAEVLTFDSHDMSLVVSGYCRTGAPPRWDDVPLDRTWDTMPELVPFGVGPTWDDAVCLGPLPIGDTWGNAPTALRWDTVPTSTTWNSYPD